MAHIQSAQSDMLIAQADYVCGIVPFASRDLRHSWITLLFTTLALGSMLVHAADDTPPGCPAGDCGITESGIKPYNAIVIGHPIKVLNEDEMRTLYRWAKQSAWKDFPDSEADYLERNRVVLLPTGVEDKNVLVHMATPDYDAKSYVPAALIRYTPRAMPESYYPDGRPIHSVLAGCVGLVCSAGDAACHNEYPQGMFRFNDGIELDPITKTPRVRGRVIDPVSMREKVAANRKLRRTTQSPNTPWQSGDNS
ncbi:hypothetical protein AGMMS50225_02400 [Betaproteobacteria bacterium]|nr:hypothetical protein AGMMS50225_02400 [Betaproteobacteria bacterium]